MPNKINLSAQIGPTVRAELARRGLTQADLSNQLGISGAGVSNRMTGITAWDINELDTVARYLDLPLTALLPTEASA